MIQSLKVKIFILALLTSTVCEAFQVSGNVSDVKGDPLIGVNVYLKDTYVGATTDLDGEFSFETTLDGKHILVVSMVGYKTHEQEIDLNKSLLELSIILKEDVNKLNAVVITAGSFEAGDKNKAEVLKSLDIAMTAGATADISGALSKLPGTTTNGESGRLFVRGGTANETQAFIDGVWVNNFYSPSASNIPTRSRFSPFLFKGTFFSTGGYSAEYGQGLSSVLSLSSNDVPPQTQTDISLMTVGTDISHTQKWDGGSLYGQVQYTDLDPYQHLIKQDIQWIDPYTSANGTFMIRKKDQNHGMLKLYANVDRSSFDLIMPGIDNPSGDRVDATNDNLYVNSSYKYMVGKKSMGFVGVSFGKNINDLQFNDIGILETAQSGHLKGYVQTDLSGLSVKAGAELLSNSQNEEIQLTDGNNQSFDFTNHLVASFVEADIYLSSRITLRGGMRLSNYTLLNETALSPRVSMAVKTGANSQLSAAYGDFHQLPENDILLRSQEVKPERADHYILSYQTTPNGRVFRAEIYRKDYRDLVKFNPEFPFDPAQYLNTGKGYAQGLDIFWRDSKTFKNTDYWISYSYIDTQRNFRDNPGMATPTFAAKHNLSVVHKYFVPVLKTQFGASYSINSGRPYYNPNLPGFNQELTPIYSDLSFNFAFLYRQNIILYGSVTNLLGRDNIFGYEFESNPGPDNYYNSRPIGQPAKRFLFIGLFITLTKDNQANNLENL